MLTLPGTSCRSNCKDIARHHSEKLSCLCVYDLMAPHCCQARHLNLRSFSDLSLSKPLADLLKNVQFSIPSPVTQLNCPLANDDTDDEDDQPPQQAHTLFHQLGCKADKNKPDINSLRINPTICQFYIENMSMPSLLPGK